MFIMHGKNDSLLPARQSVRLCNALNGSLDTNLNVASTVQTLSESNVTDLASVFLCGNNGSQLHLIAEGEHALDLCLSPGLCLSGSELSANQVARSIQGMLDWSSAESVESEGSPQSKSGLGAVHWLMLPVLLISVSVRRNKPRQFC